MASQKRPKTESEKILGFVSVGQALDVLRSLNELRQEEFVCDFVIRVGDSSFPVHRVVLAACSDYFKAMFSHEMKENQQGFVEMKNLESEAVKQCIDFLYTGNAVLNEANIQGVLQAAYVMLLQNLVKFCYCQLTSNLNAENCFTTREIARVFSNEELSRIASKFVVDNFNDVILSEGFRNLAKEDVFSYVSSYVKDHKVTWEAIVVWIKHDFKARKKDLYELMTYANVGKFPIEYILGTVWKSPMVKENSKIKDWIVACIFSRVENLESSIDFENCFLIKRLSKIYYHDNSKNVKETVDSFMTWYFEKIVDIEGFLELDAAEVQMYLVDAEHASEIKKWEATLKWVKHDIDKRKTSFPKIFKCIDLDEIPVSFIQSDIRAESLVKECDECKEIITNAFCNKLRNIGPTHYLLVLCKASKQVLGLDSSANIWTTTIDVPQISDDTKFSRIVTVRNTVYLLADETLYQMKKKNWIERGEMEHKPDETSQAVSFQNCIYLVEHNKLSKYDPKESVWMEDMAPCGIRWFVAVTATDDHIYVFGCTDKDRNTPEIKRFHPQQNIWETVAPWPERLYNNSVLNQQGYAAVVLDGDVYTIGGYSRYHSRPSNEVLKYDPSINIWSRIKQMSQARSNFCAINIGGRMFVIGGESSSGAATIEIYNKQKNEWILRSSSISHPTSICDYIKW